MLLAFFSPIEIYFVLQTPARIPFSTKKKSNLKRLWAIALIFDLFSITFLIAVTVRIANYFTGNMRVMNMSFVVHNSFYVLYKIFRYWNTLNFFCFFQFDKRRVYESNNFICKINFYEFSFFLITTFSVSSSNSSAVE